MVYRLGFANSRKQARQIVSHGHILVNGRKTNIPSYSVKKDDEIKLKKKCLKLPFFAEISSILKNKEIVSWLNLDTDKLTAKVVAEPSIDDVEKVGDTSMIIEYYSR